MTDMNTGLFQDRLFMPIMVLICIIAVCFLGLSAASIMRNRDHHINESITKSMTRARLAGENIAGRMYTVDFALLSAASMIKSQVDNDGVIRPDTIAFIKQEITYLPQIRDIVFTHAHGDQQWRIRETDQPITLSSFDQFHSTWLESAIETVPSEDGPVLILLSRRVENRHNAFIGVLTAVIDTDFFYNRYEDDLHLDTGGLALFDSQGRVMASWFNRPDIQTHLFSPDNSSTTVLPAIISSSSMPGASITHEDEHTVISTYQLRNFPFHMAVIQYKKDLLTIWHQETRRDITLIIATFVTALITLLLALWQRKQRTKAEYHLIRHQQDLTETVQHRTQELQSANAVLQEKNRDLEAAMKQIKTLSGLLPICMHCKKIRDDKGYWQQMETYIHKHSDAQFSHSICRECAEQYYPDLDIYDD
jgi:hypothetical protein